MSLNRAIIVGNLGKTPELRRTPSGTPVCDLSVATTESFADTSGERRAQTEWHKVVVWGKAAENCAAYLTKGRPVCVEGRLRTRAWEDPSGRKRYTTEIVASRVRFLGRGSSSDHPSPSATMVKDELATVFDLATEDEGADAVVT